jgi:putative glutamine amidotransferase
MVESTQKKIGLTMRIIHAKDYDEPRDALAQDWGRFLAFAMPEILWFPIPNLGSESVDFVKQWEIDGLILTGGNDIGSAPLRDLTEKALFEYALSKDLPVFGVCRGLQFIHHYFGGSQLTACPIEEHVACRHIIDLKNHPNLSDVIQHSEQEVNSFHNFAIEKQDIVNNMIPFALCKNWVEGFLSEKQKLIGVQWHPEREKPFRDFDRILMRHFFNL